MRKVDEMLRPERDFIENADYLEDLVERINTSEDSTKDKDLLKEVVLADYYINKLVQKSSKDTLLNIGTLNEISAIFRGVLDTAETLPLANSDDEFFAVVTDEELAKDIESFKNMKCRYLVSHISRLVVVGIMFYFFIETPIIVDRILDSMLDFFISFSDTFKGIFKL